MKNNSYYISLGAGNNQYPLIQAAKKKGFSVIGIDADQMAPGFTECDIKIQESIYNYRKIHFKISMALMQKNISGGYSASYGNALLSWSFLAERFKLNGLTRTQTEALIDKYNVRSKIQRNLKNEILHQPAFIPLENNIYKDQLDDFSYPLIIKTRWGFGKNNIYRIENYSELKKFLTKKNLKELNVDPISIMIEEEISGDEITVTGLVENYKYHLSIITDKITTKYPPFVEIKHIFPSQYNDLKNDIEVLHQDLIEVLDISSGPVVSEFKIKDGKLHLIEITPQIPGEFIAKFIIPKSLKYDYFSSVVDITTGKSIEISPFMKKKFKPEKKVTVKYFLEKISTQEWEKNLSQAAFGKILNENASFPPQSNKDRFGVMGFISPL